MISSAAIAYPCFGKRNGTAFITAVAAYGSQTLQNGIFTQVADAEKTSLSGSTRRLVDLIRTVAPLKVLKLLRVRHYDASFACENLCQTLGKVVQTSVGNTLLLYTSSL